MAAAVAGVGSMRVLRKVDGWIQQWAIRDEIARNDRVYWKLFLPQAFFWKLFGAFFVPAALISLSLEVTAGDRASAAFQLVSSVLLASAFLWRFLVHRNAHRARSKVSLK